MKLKIFDPQRTTHPNFLCMPCEGFFYSFIDLEAIHRLDHWKEQDYKWFQNEVFPDIM